MTCCPYFAMKDRAHLADVIFMPYNYLIDETYRENFNITWENSIIIFDEAHNITSSCEETASFSIESQVLEKVVTELTELQDYIKQNPDKQIQSSDESFQHLKMLT